MNESDERRICRNCIWCRIVDAAAAECRRFPPTVVVYTTPHQTQLTNGPILIDANYRTVFPRVKHDTSCGEFANGAA